MKTKQRPGLVGFMACLLFGLAWAGPVLAENERSIYGSTPPSTFTLYALDPELLAGWNTPLRDYEKKYIPAKYHDLPILGGWYGEGFIPDREELLASGLKTAFYLSAGAHDNLRIAETLEALGMKVVTVPGHRLADMAECFRTMGREFGRPERGEALARYADASLAKVREAIKALPPEKQTRVYLALEADGMATVCRQSERSEVLETAGAVNVHECPSGTEEAFLRITFEQLMRYDPEVILVYHPDLMRTIPTDARWRRLSAVRAGRCYFMPRGPFSWLERPASYMRLIGLQWLAGQLHPNLYPVDIKSESKAFMKLFFNIDLNERQLDDLFKPYGTF
jgi:iron complex transport system substrate-binding protein